MKNSLNANAYYKRQLDFSRKSFEQKNLMPRRYVLVLTNLCNLACTFCFQERKKKPDRMKRRLDKSIGSNTRQPRITLTIGEPTVYKDFKCFSKAVSTETNMITNGLLLGNQRIDHLLNHKNFKVLAISIDTLGNKNRDFKKGQWDYLVKQLNEFVKLRDKKSHGVALDIKTVILEDSIDELFDLHKFVMEVLRADTHSLQLLKGAEIQHSDLMFDFEQIDDDYKAYQYKTLKNLSIN